MGERAGAASGFAPGTRWQLMISVVVPAYNRANFLCGCIAPLMELPQGAIEVLVVDDCSTDDTPQLCAALVQKYGEDRLRYCRLERNQGAPAARNYGLTKARGEFVMFVDSDDVPVVCGIRRLLDKLRTSDDLDYAYGEVVITDAELRVTPGYSPVGSEWDGSCGELAGYHWHTMGALYRRNFLQKVGDWNCDLAGSQDWEFQARVKASGGKGRFVPVTTGYWRQHSESRLGTTVFRPEYNRSVMKACASIIAHAKAANMCDQVLEYRIGRRLLVHAVGWGGEGYADMKRACLTQAAETAPDSTSLRLLGCLLKRTPQPVDWLVDSALRKIQSRA